MAKFEGQERRMPKIEACLAEYGWKTLEDADALCKEHGINVEEIVKGVQPIAFENACWAYTLGTAIALKKAAKLRPTLPRPSAWACRHSASPVPLRSKERLAWVMVTWVPCC